MSLELVTLAERPDLLPTLLSWLGERRTRPLGPEFCFILLAPGADAASAIPAGTASLAAAGLATRPDLTPWLANLFVPPAFRGRGYAQYLVAAVEQAARAARIPALWLVTRSASGLYHRLGWRSVEPALFQGEPATLMRRDFSLIPAPAAAAVPLKIRSRKARNLPQPRSARHLPPASGSAAPAPSARS